MPKKKKKKKKVKRKPQIQHKPFYENIKPSVPEYAQPYYPKCDLIQDEHEYTRQILRRLLYEIDHYIIDDQNVWDDPPRACDFLQTLFGYSVTEEISGIDPCKKCKYYHRNPYIKCAVNPLRKDEEPCSYWEEK